MSSKPRILAGISAYDEERSIGRVVIQTSMYVDKVIVADDGSHDMTGPIAEGLGAIVARHERNLGKGEALRTIFKLAGDLKADVLVTLDADGQHDPSEIPKLVQPILDGVADVVVGSRLTRPQSMPRLRRIAQKTLDLATGVRDDYGAMLDTQSGFKAYSSHALGRIRFGEWGMGAESEIMRALSSEGLRVRQVPVNISYGEGVGRKHKQSPILHFSDVFSAVLKTSVLRRPLRFVGLPSVALLLLGLYGWFEVMSVFETTGQLPLGHAFVYAVVLLAGFFLGVGAILLFAIRLAAQER